MLLRKSAWQAAPILSTLAVLGILGAGDAPVSAATPQYQITDLSSFGFARAYDINNSGAIVGASSPLYDGSALLYSDATVRTLAAGVANGINDRGQVVGDMRITPDGPLRAVLYDGSSFTDLTQIIGHPSASAVAINNAGTILGSTARAGGNEAPPPGTPSASDTPNNGPGAVIYSFSTFTLSNNHTTYIDLGTLGGNSASPAGINDAGTVVGTIRDGSQLRGFARDAGGALTLLPAAPGPGWYIATAINSSGQIAGYRATAGGESAHAFTFQGGTYADLAPLAGFNSSEALAINDRGQVVGMLTKPRTNGLSGDTATAFVFSDGAMHDLNALLVDRQGWSLEFAGGINNAGQIIGMGTLNGRTVPFLATPVTTAAVPLPAAAGPATATLAGLAALGAARRRRHNRTA